MSNKKEKKGEKINLELLKKKRLIPLAISVILIIFSTVYLLVNIAKLANVENLLRLIACCILVVISLLFITTGYKTLKGNKKPGLIVFIVMSVLYVLVTGFINYNFQYVYDRLHKTSTNIKTYTLSLVTLSENEVSNIKDIGKDKIGVISDKEIANGYKLAETVLDRYHLDNELYEFDTYLEIVDALYKGNIQYAFLPETYNVMFQTYDEYLNITEYLKTIYTETKEEKEDTDNKVEVGEPFTMLLMGVDTLENSYNADTLLVITFNPKTLSTTMLSIPRDTYTTIACTGGKHKINSSGWYGDGCVVDTVSKYLDIKINYYAKVNFTGVVDLVNALGGITVDVPYAFCEQDSQRRFGTHTVYVDKGIQNLNGEQALALSRNRHYWDGYDGPAFCSGVHVEEGPRNDFQRGRNQQLVFKALLQKLTSVNNINTIYNLIDSLSNNLTTNMDTKTLFSFYNIGKDLVKRLGNSSVEEVINIKKLGFTSYTPYVRISGIDLSMVVNYDESVGVVKKAMKENLGLTPKTSTLNLKFDINNVYEEATIGAGIYGKITLEVLPDFRDYDLEYAKSYLDSRGITLNIDYQKVSSDSGYKQGQIIDQTPDYDTDIATMNKNKGVTLKVVELEKTPIVGYAACLIESDNYNDICYVPDFVGSSIDTFNEWVLEVSKLNIRTSKETVVATDNNGLIVEQNEYKGKTLYEVYNNNYIISVKYNTVEEPEEPVEPDNPIDGESDDQGE